MLWCVPRRKCLARSRADWEATGANAATNIVKAIKNIGSEVILAQRQFGF
ncbi:hypothetical protein SD15574_2726 [Shigella dysenteriae 155-74]|nr:hypothetical protein SD15574_2726 [Shigella dysenteriae 155-74]